MMLMDNLAISVIDLTNYGQVAIEQVDEKVVVYFWCDRQLFSLLERRIAPRVYYNSLQFPGKQLVLSSLKYFDPPKQLYRGGLMLYSAPYWDYLYSARLDLKVV